MCTIVKCTASSFFSSWFECLPETYAAELQDELKKRLSGKGADHPAPAAVEKTSHLAVAPNRKHDDAAPSPGDTLIDLRVSP